MWCENCTRQIFKQVYCPIDIKPDYEEFKLKTLCQTEYIIKQPITKNDIKSMSNIINEKIIYYDKPFCSNECIYNFLNKNIKNNLFNKSAAILSKKMNVLIYIEGNIGAGKSTLLKKILEFNFEDNPLIAMLV